MRASLAKFSKDIKKHAIIMLVPTDTIVCRDVLSFSMLKKLSIYLLMISIMIDTIDGLKIQFFKSIIRLVRFSITIRFRTKLMDSAKIRPKINPDIPYFGITKNTKSILMP